MCPQTCMCRGQSSSFKNIYNISWRKGGHEFRKLQGGIRKWCEGKKGMGDMITVILKLKRYKTTYYIFDSVTHWVLSYSAPQLFPVTPRWNHCSSNFLKKHFILNLKLSSLTTLSSKHAAGILPSLPAQIWITDMYYQAGVFIWVLNTWIEVLMLM